MQSCQLASPSCKLGGQRCKPHFLSTEHMQRAGQRVRRWQERNAAQGTQGAPHCPNSSRLTNPELLS